MDENSSRLHVATTVNTADKEAERKYHQLLDQVYPKAEEEEQRLREKLLVYGSVPAGLEIPLLKMRSEVELFRDANLPLFVEEHKLSMEYDKIIGAQTVQWEGKEITVAQLRPVYQNAYRDL